MKPDSILEELWDVKDELARASGYDANRFLENLRRWETEHPHLGNKTIESAEFSDLVLKDEPTQKV